jgi:hypothetical protein
VTAGLKDDFTGIGEAHGATIGGITLLATELVTEKGIFLARLFGRLFIQVGAVTLVMTVRTEGITL